MIDTPDLVDFQELARRWDHSHMARVIAGMGSQIEFALRDPDFPQLRSEGIEEVVVVGMGGSALPVDILNDVLEDRLPRSIRICRHYRLPSATAGRRLLVFSSFSGNTEEVVEPLQRLSSAVDDVAIITAGGQLAEIGRARRIPTVLIPAAREPDGFQPRCASGYIVTYLARLLGAVGYADLPFDRFEALVPIVRDLDLRAEGETLARALDGRIPVFYADEAHLRSVARIAKIKINENAKRPAFFNALPEANHNEMIGFSGAVENFAVLYLRDPTSHPRVHQRFEVLQSVLTGPNITLLEWEMRGSNCLERVFSALTLADWISYSAALLRGVDPTPVTLVEDFKRLLTEGAPDPRP